VATCVLATIAVEVAADVVAIATDGVAIVGIDTLVDANDTDEVAEDAAATAELKPEKAPENIACGSPPVRTIGAAAVDEREVVDGVLTL